MSRKFLITVILILFLLPFVSWYYLQSGLNWRKQAQAIMNGKQPFPEGQWMDVSGKKLSSDQLADHVTIVNLVTCDNIEVMSGILDAFYKQFKETKKANFIILNSCENAPFALQDSLRAGWFVFTCSDTLNLCSKMLPNWPPGKDHALIDRHQIIRSYYNDATKDEKRLLLEHMALLLPRQESEKIELKRGEQK
jgi:hypothetical protein